MRKFLFLALLVPSLVFSAYSIQNDSGAKLNISADMLNAFSYAKSAAGVTTHGFGTLRGRLMFSGTFNERINYAIRFKFDAATTGGTNNSMYGIIDYAYFGYKFFDELKVTIGKQVLLIGAWRHYSLSGMSPQSFIIAGSKFSTPYSPSLMVSGKVIDLVNYEVMFANDTETYAGANLDKRYSFLAHFWFSTGPDINFYKMSEGFKYTVGVSAASVAALNVVDRPVISPYFLMTYNNMFLTTSSDIELTENAKTYQYQVGAGYLFAEQFRPSLTYRAYRIEGSAQKTEHTLATQFMVFTYGGMFKPFIEYATTVKKTVAPARELRIGAALNI